MGKLVLPGRYANLAQIAEFVRLAAKSAGLDNSAVYQVETAVDEACTNIIEHSYGGESSELIECTAEVTGEGLMVILRDTGKPFKPQKIRKPNPKTPLAKRDNHGLGLYIMSQWMDEVKFSFEPGLGNVLTMIKRRGLQPK